MNVLVKEIICNNVWNVFKINIMGDFHELYLNTDFLLLADFFEKFINACLEYYGLDPCYYFNSPGLNWDAMFKMNKIELELISYIDMYLFVEEGMGGGIYYIAIIKYMQPYDDKKPSKYITCLDANSLYG